MERVADLACEVWAEEEIPFSLTLEVERIGTRNSVRRLWNLKVERSTVLRLQNNQIPDQDDWDRAFFLVEEKEKWNILDCSVSL